jgi:UDP-GlcNAc:undecaprenyl-phosphate/decaprenyl-phosphate GlcNAc-1-phosphate transferase
VVAVVAAAVALVATPVAARVAVVLGVLDRPGPLKVHTRAVPYLGGAAVVVAMGAALASHRLTLLLPLGLALALGVTDDVRHVDPRIRLVCEAVIGAAAGAVAPAPGPVGGLVTAVLVVVLINAVNLLDGLDGLASAVVLSSALVVAVLGGDARPLALALAGALAGFLVFNRPPARIYLGDGGSYAIGTALAMVAALALHEGSGAAWMLLPLLVAVPVADTSVAILRRMRARVPLFEGDRSHLYDQLVDRGVDRVHTVLVCITFQALAAAIAIAAWHAPVAWGAAVAAATVAAVAAAVVRFGFLTNEVRR